MGPGAPKLVSLHGRNAKAGLTDPTFLLLPFSSMATEFFSPPNKGDRERVSGGAPAREALRLPPGEVARLAGWIETIFVYTGCQCLFSVSVCLSHTPPFTDSLTHPSFMLPLWLLQLSRPSLRFLVPAAPLPGSGSDTENHSFTLLMCTAHPHCCPAHTHTYCSGTVSCTLSVTHSVSLPLLSCAHLHTHTARELLVSVPTSQLLAAEDRVTLWMPSPLVTTPPSTSTPAPHRSCWRHLSHV